MAAVFTVSKVVRAAPGQGVGKNTGAQVPEMSQITGCGEEGPPPRTDLQRSSQKKGGLEGRSSVVELLSETLRSSSQMKRLVGKGTYHHA